MSRFDSTSKLLENIGTRPCSFCSSYGMSDDAMHANYQPDIILPSKTTPGGIIQSPV